MFGHSTFAELPFSSTPALGPPLSYETITRIAQVQGVSTTGAINTTGATFLIAHIGGDTSFSIGDSQANTWVQVIHIGAGQNTKTRLFYCANPVTSESHTFTCNLSYGYVSVVAYTGVDLVNPVQAFDGLRPASATTGYSLGLIVPDRPNSMFIAAGTLGNNASSPTVSPGPAIVQSINGVTSVSYGGFYAEEIQTTPTSRTLVLSFTNTSHSSMAIAVFRAARIISSEISIGYSNTTESTNSYILDAGVTLTAQSYSSSTTSAQSYLALYNALKAYTSASTSASSYTARADALKSYSTVSDSGFNYSLWNTAPLSYAGSGSSASSYVINAAALKAYVNASTSASSSSLSAEAFTSFNASTVSNQSYAHIAEAIAAYLSETYSVQEYTVRSGGGITTDAIRTTVSWYEWATINDVQQRIQKSVSLIATVREDSIVVIEEPGTTVTSLIVRWQ